MANEIAKLTADLNIIAKLDDEPNDVGGLSAAELKAEFDKAGLAIQKYINETLLPNVDEISDSFMLVRVTGEAPGLVADKTAKEINDFAAAGGLPVMVIGDTASAIYYNPKRYPGAAPFVAVIGQTAPGEREGTMQTIVLTVRMDKSVDVKSYDHNTSAKAHMDIRALVSRNQQSLKLLKDAVDRHIADMDNPHGVTYDQVGADPAGAADAAQAAAISGAMGNVVVADCFDVAESPTSAPNTWYVPKTSPRPSGEAGMTIDVRWKNGRVDGLGYDVSLIWGAPDGSDNETVVSAASVSTGLSGTYSIPTEGTVRYQLIEQSGRLCWHYVSGKLLPRQFSSATAAATADKSVPGMEVEYLPGMEIYVQMDNGNTADVMRLVPDSGPTLPVYGNGAGAKTGEIPAGYILHLVSAGDHWQIINGGGDGKVKTVNGNLPDKAGNVIVPIPSRLAQLTGDSTHRTVTDAEKDKWNAGGGGGGGGVTPEQLNEAIHTTLNVEIEDDGFGGYRADKNDAEINNHRNAGGLVQAKYYDSSSDQTYTYYYSTMESDRQPTFIRTYINSAGEVIQVLASIDNTGRVTRTERKAKTGSGKGEVFTVTFSSTAGALGKRIYTCDKTAEEINAAFERGAWVWGYESYYGRVYTYYVGESAGAAFTCREDTPDKIHNYNLHVRADGTVDFFDDLYHPLLDEDLGEELGNIGQLITSKVDINDLTTATSDMTQQVGWDGETKKLVTKPGTGGGGGNLDFTKVGSITFEPGGPSRFVFDCNNCNEFYLVFRDYVSENLSDILFSLRVNETAVFGNLQNYADWMQKNKITQLLIHAVNTGGYWETVIYAGVDNRDNSVLLSHGIPAYLYSNFNLIGSAKTVAIHIWGAEAPAKLKTGVLDIYGR